MAHRYMSRERPGHTLQTTALVNEAYLRLVNWKEVRWQNRAHFFAVSAQMMRRILVDFARDRQYLKRGGGALQVSLGEAAAFTECRTADLVALDEALTALSEGGSAEGPGRGDAFLWRAVGQGSGRGAEGFRRDGDAGLAAGEGVAPEGARSGG